MTFKYFSTFSGIGGFELGIHGAIEDSECVGYSEIDRHAMSVFARQFKGVKNYGDITKIIAEELPDFDCLVGGFPCQAFSIAGKRKGFEDTRGTLFFDLARILRAKQPRLFVFENVKGLQSHDDGRTFKTIIATITELGYDCQWQVLNSKNHGVPQNRERVIIVGNLRGTPRPEVFPIGGYAKVHPDAKAGAESETKHTFSTISTRIDRRESNYVIGTLRTHKDGQGFREMQSGMSPTIPARAREDGSGQPVVRVPEATVKGYAEATVGQAINLNQINSKTRRGRVSDVSPTLDTTAQIYTLTEFERLRRLTPIECERLQGFPDDWTRYGYDEQNARPSDRGGYITKETIWDYPVLRHIKKTVRHADPLVLMSDTQRYKMCGNAVTTNVIKEVFSRIAYDL